jgi:transcription factor TFIIIB component B''
MRIIDGQIVVDESSMQVDRHQISQAGQGEIEQITENEFSTIITSGTHMKRERAQLWDMAANETFYKGLRMFGTDFEMIAGLFPHRNRRQIKLKFCKEEKDNPVRIDKILKGIGSSIELDTYEKLSGRQLEEVADIEAERVRIEAEQQAEENRRIAEQAEAERKKREAITAKSLAVKKILDTAGEEGNIGDNGDSGEKENQPRQTQSRGNNPQEILHGERPQHHSTTRNPKAAKAPKAPKQGAAKNKRKKDKGGADETVQVLGDA